MPNIYTIPPGYSFLDSFAKGLLKSFEKDPFAFCKMEIFLPTRRACIELGRVFMRHEKEKPILLPKLSTLGDLDAEELEFSQSDYTGKLKPLIPSYKRLGLLMQLIDQYSKKSDLPTSPELSLKLAKSLVQLMDQAAIEEIPWEGLINLVPSEFASHWQLTLDFLEIITTYWPRIVEEKGYIEPYVRHHQLVDLLIQSWEKHPPQHPILAAGSTGTMPATARLLKAIAELPQGAVILPGFDNEMSSEEAVSLTPCHPQYAPSKLIQKLQLIPSQVPNWPDLDGNCNKDRARLYKETLNIGSSLRFTPPNDGLEGISYIPCPSPQEEALTIAILLRKHLETPHLRTALITSDLKLAERVTWELKRWGIEIDNSSGDKLEITPPAVFVKLCMEYVVNLQDQVALLSLMKHPLFQLEKKADVRKFEMASLRGATSGVIPAKAGTQGINPLRSNERISTFLRNELFFLGPRFRGDDARGCGDDNLFFKTHLENHLNFAETLSTDEQGICQLWKGAKGEALRAFFDTLIESADDFPDCTVKEYTALMAELLKGQTIRFRPQKHPRLAILGPIEARLFSADVMILGGLNEGSWPPQIDVDPWLNRPMRTTLGFPSPERRIGLSSHDFGQALSCPKVYLTRALKVDGTPTLACRWLERLEVYLKGQHLSLHEDFQTLIWAQKIDQPGVVNSSTPPSPRPPVDARPRRLSVTQVETWMRDPYALYARMILSLSSLDPLNATVDVSDRGTLIHAALDQFFKICPDPHQKDALDILLNIGKTLFEPYTNEPSVRLFWWPRFCALGDWFITYERANRLMGTHTFTEVKGQLTLMTNHGPFELIAKADRIDLLPSGLLRIIDYKTGTPPSNTDVLLGFSPQLPLEGAIALAGGFEGISSSGVESLEFWWLKGDTKGGIIRTVPGDAELIAQASVQGLKNLIETFENEETPYTARPLINKGLTYNDYSNLARIGEWGRL